MPLDERTYECSQCGHVADRDFNAALNLAEAPDDKLKSLEPLAKGGLPVDGLGADTPGRSRKKTSNARDTRYARFE